MAFFGLFGKRARPRGRTEIIKYLIAARGYTRYLEIVDTAHGCDVGPVGLALLTAYIHRALAVRVSGTAVKIGAPGSAWSYGRI